ncbi:DinB family protein [Puniceibacterium confluentis]|uniref:DinB family protein n=1 Tax=Puniceibacterium confluentis TaxID=1958944 RepID=UPI0035661617
MISPSYCTTMARYNAWQNGQLRAAFAVLSAADWAQERGAFFGSIRATASHLLWGDTIWMSRFDGGDAPAGGIADSGALVSTVSEWSLARGLLDARIARWAEGLRPEDLDGPLTWYSGAVRAQVTQPLALCVAHMFNHQTHHRGQIHAMLTAAGSTAPVSDLAFMPAAPG